MNRSALVIFFALACCFSAVSARAQSFDGGYGPAKKPRLLELQEDLKRTRTIENIATVLSQGIVLPEKISIVSGECGTSNAMYVPKKRVLVLCLELLHEVASGIARDFRGHHSNEEIKESIVGALLFILYHELGHALIHQLNLPVLGREEDAADQIGLFFTLKTLDPKPALAGALWFFRQKTILFTRQHFADEHSLGPQRQTNLACWAYGKDPVKFGFLLQSGLLPKSRAVRCGSEYAQLDSAVRELLAGKVQLD